MAVPPALVRAGPSHHVAVAAEDVEHERLLARVDRSRALRRACGTSAPAAAGRRSLPASPASPARRSSARVGAMSRPSNAPPVTTSAPPLDRVVEQALHARGVAVVDDDAARARRRARSIARAASRRTASRIALVDEQVVGRDADLAAVEELAPGDLLRRLVEIRGAVDDDRRLAAQLERDRTSDAPPPPSSRSVRPRGCR